MAVIFIFVDGIGIGNKSEENPFFTHEYESFNLLSGGNFSKSSEQVLTSNHIFKPIDANLGVEGLPQSGTGQTSLFTGENASKLIGKHFGPYPHSGIKPLLKTQSVFQGLIDAGKAPYFINAYPPRFFEFARKRNRWTCTTLMTKSAGLSFNSIQEVREGKALTAEIIQNAWREKLEIDIPEITPVDAANIMLGVARLYDLVLFEYYLTDKAGHNQSHSDAQRVLKPLDEFLLQILRNKQTDDIVVITSDHGNLEDLSTKTHTRNHVPLFVVGPDIDHFGSINSLVDVKEAILKSIV